MNRKTGMEEPTLAERCRQGDNAARRMLYDLYAGRLLSICKRYTGDRAAAEDLLHDTFIKAFGAIGKFRYRGEGSLRAWLERIAVNTSIEYLRSRSRMSCSPLDERRPLPDSAEPAGEEAALVPVSELMRMIAELPAGYRTVFNLFCVEGLSHREIAGMLGINEKSSSSQLARAKAVLAGKIKEYLDKSGHDAKK